MAERVTIKGTVVVYGLTWVPVRQAAREKAELLTLIREAQAKYYVRCQASEINYGVVSGSQDWSDATVRLPMLSGAMLFADHVVRHPPGDAQNSLLIQRVGEARVALVALLKGVPYLDIVTGDDELHGQLKSLYGEGHAGRFVVYGNLPDLVEHNLTPEDLVSGDWSGAIVRRFTDPVRNMQKIAFIAAGIAVIGGYVIWEELQNMRQQEQAKKAADPVLVYEARVQEILAAAHFDANAAIQVIWPVLLKREISMAGWALTSIRCKPTLCEELWQPGQGSFAALKQKVPAPQRVRLQSNRVTSAIEIPLAGKMTALRRETLPAKEIMWTGLIDQQQRMKRIHPQLLFTPKMPEIRGLSPEIAEASIPVDRRLYTGELAVSAPLGLAEEIFRQHLQHIMISEVAVEAADDVRHARILIKGNYYAKNE